MQLFPYQMIGALIGYGLIARFLYLFSFYESMERLPIHKVSMMLPLITVGSLLFSNAILKEQIAWYHIFGGAMIIAGSAVMQLSTTHFKGKHLSFHLRHSNRHHI
jgi:drug/metabolite transporter (DMT)-like permease